MTVMAPTTEPIDKIQIDLDVPEIQPVQPEVLYLWTMTAEVFKSFLNAKNVWLTTCEEVHRLNVLFHRDILLENAHRLIDLLHDDEFKANALSALIKIFSVSLAANPNVWRQEIDTRFAFAHLT